MLHLQGIDGTDGTVDLTSGTVANYTSDTVADHTSDVRPDVPTGDKVDSKSSLLYRFCICLSIDPNKPYHVSMQAVTKM